MTSVTESIEAEVEQVVEESVAEMREKGLSPRASDVCLDEEELFANVWFNESDNLTDRKEQAMKILKQKLNEADLSIPTTINANYQTNPKEDMIICWWPV